MRLCLLLLSLSGTALAQPAPLVITPLTADHYVYTTWRLVNGKPFPSNSLYTVTTAGIVLLDTPWDTTQFQPLLDSLWRRHRQRPVLCLATHSHDDRTAGLGFLRQQGVKTYASRQTLARCRQQGEQQPEYTFRSDTLFTVGNHTFQTFYPGEGHAPDNLVVWCAGARVLYGGCLVKSTENQGLGNLTDANLAAWPAAIKRVMRKFPGPAFVIPGHFGWTSNQGLPHTLRLLRQQRKK